MGNARFLYNNLVTDESMITVSSLRTGVVTDAKKEGAGAAIITTSGNYTGSLDKEYIIEIDSVAVGAEIGQATFRWSNGGGSWNASGVATSSVSILLEAGVYIKWTAGTGDDFVIADKWYLKGINLWNANAMIDLDRDHRYRSAALESPNTIVIDLGSAQTFDSLVIYDHNLTNAAAITLEADAAATFDSNGGSPQVSESVTWNADKILHYLAASATKQHARLKITDAENPDGYIEIGELFLSSYLELTKNYIEGYSKGFEFIYDQQVNKFGVPRNRFYNKQRKFSYKFGVIQPVDVASLEDFLDSITDRATGQLKPFFYNDDSTYPSEKTWMVDIYGMPEDHQVRDYYNVPLEFTERMTSI